MLIAIATICFATAGGAALTYLDRDPWPLSLRAAAGTFLGSVMMGLSALVFGAHWGMTPATVAAATLSAAC